MLLSGHLDEEKVILADARTLSAKFFLFREGKFLGKTGRFCLDERGSSFRVSKAEPNNLEPPTTIVISQNLKP
jgi:hypothetical protein